MSAEPDSDKQASCEKSDAKMTDSDHRAVRLIRARPMTAFLVIAFTWTVTYDVVGGRILGLTESIVGTLPRDAGPTLAALACLAATGGRQAALRVGRSLREWRLPWRWYAVVLAVIPTAYLVGVLIVVRPGAPTMPSWALLAAYPLLIVAAAIIGGPLLEEPGWRGFVQPVLQQRMAPLAAAITVGCIWACWHATGFLDDNFAESNGGRGWPALVVFAASALAVSVVIAWICNSTNGSLLMAVLAHNSVNVTQAVAADVWPGVRTETGALAAFAVLAALVLAGTRGRLGWSPTPSSATVQGRELDDDARGDALRGNSSSARPDKARLRIELFPEDLDAWTDFYTRVLRFTVQRDERHEQSAYVSMQRGTAHVGAALRHDRIERSHRHPPVGVEIVLEVSDVRAERDFVAERWEISEDLKDRPWGLSDFRVLDPAGYYIRITSPSASPRALNLQTPSRPRRSLRTRRGSGRDRLADRDSAPDALGRIGHEGVPRG